LSDSKLNLIDDQEIKKAFYDEAYDIFIKLDNKLSDYQRDLDSALHAPEVFRHLHTLKGHTGYIQDENLKALVHHSVELFRLIKNKKLLIQQDMFPLLFEAIEIIRHIMVHAEQDQSISTDIETLLERFAQYSKTKKERNKEKTDLGIVVDLLGIIQNDFINHKKLIKELKQNLIQTDELARNDDLRELIDNIESKMVHSEFNLDEFEQKFYKLNLLKFSYEKCLPVYIDKQEYLFLENDIQLIISKSFSKLKHLGDKVVINIEDTVIPIYDMYYILELQRMVEPNDNDLVKIIIIENKGTKYGFLVDSIEKPRNVSIKRIQQIQNDILYNGASINPKGEIALLFNKNGLIEKGVHQSSFIA
jgi:chemotaxis protein histidine kinase CheA